MKIPDLCGRRFVLLAGSPYFLAALPAMPEAMSTHRKYPTRAQRCRQTNRLTRLSRLGLACLLAAGAAQGAEKPNIIFILCDDLGYGDVQCLNPKHGKIPTPAMDNLAAQGMTFTDAHSGSSVCTPTRYGLLTGRYSWRTELQQGVVQGFAPCLIDRDRPTVANFLQTQDYRTAVIGKWHLNFQYQDPATGKVLGRAEVKDHGNLAPLGAKIPDGPLNRGFDYFHGFHHAGDMRAVIENDTVIAYDDVIDMLPRLTRQAVDYIDEQATQHPDQPFFLYLPLGSPHVPIVPTPEWQGKSGLGDYGDFVMQTDATLKRVLEALERNGIADKSLVIFSSDNGCSKAADIDQLREQGHWVSAEFRGSKADLWDGGHRVPFIVRWPGKIEPGSHSDQLICLTDFFATMGEMAGVPLPTGAAEDSVSFLPAFFGKPIISTRRGVVHHSISGHFGYREGRWKLLLARGSGGWTAPREKDALAHPTAQLYDLEKDPGETTNLYKIYPEVVAQLLGQLESDVFRGRSTEGPAAGNDVPNDQIVLWKSGKP